MSTYNEPVNYVKEAITSIRYQTYSKIEICVIVDDPTNIDVICYLNQVKKTDSRIKVYVNDCNIGLVKALNKGIEICAGKYIARMDADDIAEPSRIEKQLNKLLENELDVIGSAIRKFDDSGTLDEFVYYPSKKEDCDLQAMISSPLPHPTWLVNRKVYKELGGYREIKACEDYDFLIRAILGGFSIGNVEEVLLNYRIRDNSISKTNAYNQRTVAAYLARNYRKRRVVKLTEYDDYVKSEQFSEDKMQIEAYDEFVNELKKGKIRKAVCKFKVDFLFLFIINHQYNQIYTRKGRK